MNLEKYRPSMTEEVVHSWAVDAQQKMDELESQVKMLKLVNQPAMDYNGSGGVIVAAATVANHHELHMYDSSGWMSDDLQETYELQPTDILVAFEDDIDVNVYVLGGDGVVLV